MSRIEKSLQFQIESLENRTMMAADFDFGTRVDIGRGAIHGYGGIHRRRWFCSFAGNHAANRLLVQDHGENGLKLTGLGDTLINGQESVDFGYLSGKVTFQMKGGNDLVQFDDVTGTFRQVLIGGNYGNDQIVIGNSSIDAPVVIRGHQGVDSVWISRSTMNDDLIIQNGTSAGDVNLGYNDFRGDVVIDSGTGELEISTLDNDFLWDLEIDANRGAIDVEMNGDTVFDLTIEGGEQNDGFFATGLEVSHNTLILMGDGDDSVGIQHSTFDDYFSVNGGLGNDSFVGAHSIHDNEFLGDVISLLDFEVIS